MAKKLENFLNDIIFLDLKDLDKASYFVIFFNFAIFAISYIVLYIQRLSSVVEYGVDLITFICIILNLYVIISRIKRKEFHLKKVDILFIVLNVFYFISALLSSTKGYSFFGANGRYEGFTSLLMYATLYFVARNFKEKKYVKKLLDVILGFGLVNVFAGFVQSFFNIESISTAISFDHMAFGLMDNPNMYGLFLTLEFALAFALYLTYKEKKFLFYTFMFYIGILLAESSGPFFTIGLMCVIALIYFIIKKIKIKPLIYIYLGFILLFPIVQYGNVYVNNTFCGHDYNNPYIASDLITFIYKIDILDLIPEKISDNLVNNKKTDTDSIDISTGRVDLWKDVIEYDNDHILFGVGPDSMTFIFNGKICDKAHNHYIEVFSTSGVFAFICYVAFILSIFLISIKNKSKISLVLLFAFISFSIAVGMNISIPFATMYYYVIIGLLMALKDNKIEI